MKTIKNGGYVSWGETNYIIPTKTGLKEYYVSKTNYNGPFGTKDVLSARGSGNARFNVMALSDYNNGTKYYFKDAKNIKSGEWSMPTINTWITFAGQLNIRKTNQYREYGLKDTYWSSSGEYIGLYNGFTYSYSPYEKFPVRLSRTF